MSKIKKLKLDSVFNLLFILSMAVIYFDLTIGSNNIINYLIENYQNMLSYNIVDLLSTYKHILIFFIVFNFFESFEDILSFFSTKKTAY